MDKTKPSDTPVFIPESVEGLKGNISGVKQSARPKTYRNIGFALLLIGFCLNVIFAILISVAVSNPNVPTQVANEYQIIVGVMFVWSILLLIAALGVWLTKRWGSILGILIASLVMVSSFQNMGSNLLAIIDLIWGIVLLIVLLKLDIEIRKSR